MEKISVLRKAQLAQLKIMDAVHDACVKNGITYYIIGGTALGARRHKGFIPWDVDIDIAMPRKDYDRFLELSPQILPSEFHCLHFRNNKKHYSPHALVILRNSKLILRSDLLSGVEGREIFIDVMPLDTPPFSLKAQKKHAKLIKAINSIQYFKLGSINKWNTKRQILLKKTLKLILFPINIRFLNYIQHYCFTKYQKADSSQLCSMASHYSYAKQCMGWEIYGSPTLVNFESRQYYAPAKLDEYLTRIYGNFMQLPKIEHQERLATIVIDVNWS